MDRITKSPGLVHISETIFMNLTHDHESLLNCYMVNLTWRKILSSLLVRKCVNLGGLSKDEGIQWTRAHEDQSLKVNLITELMKLYSELLLLDEQHRSDMNRRQVMKRHIHTIHEGHKDHKCESCDKSFSQAENLKEHIYIVHEGQKDYKCESCGKSFSQARHLKLHILAVHEGYKDHKCKFSF